MMLNLGCGRDIRPGYTNIDWRGNLKADMCLNIEEPMPFENNSVSVILAFHILEHVKDLPTVMDELWRVMVPNGILHVKVPHHRHRNADTDPTHIRRFTENSFDYWLADTKFEGFSNKLWEIRKFRINGGKRLWLPGFPEFLKYWWVFPPHELEWKLSPVKESGESGGIVGMVGTNPMIKSFRPLPPLFDFKNV